MDQNLECRWNDLGPRESTFSSCNKTRDEDAPDPVSYRGIHLMSALAKLFEGVLVTRLTASTPKLTTLIQTINLPCTCPLHTPPSGPV